MLFRHKVQERFPLFVGYIGISVLVSLSRLAIFHYPYPRYFVYWISESLLILFSIVALNQVFWYTYKGFDSIWWFSPLYYGAIAVALGVTIRMAIVSPTAQAHPIISFIVDAEIAANVVRAGIVALFEALVKPMAVRFQRYPFGIIAGFGVSSVVPVLAFFVIYISGTKYEYPARILSGLSYIVALAIWLRIFSLPDTKPTKVEPPIPPGEMQNTVQGYLEALGVPRKRKK